MRGMLEEPNELQKPSQSMLETEESIPEVFIADQVDGTNAELLGMGKVRFRDQHRDTVEFFYNCTRVLSSRYV